MDILSNCVSELPFRVSTDLIVAVGSGFGTAHHGRDVIKSRSPRSLSVDEKVLLKLEVTLKTNTKRRKEGIWFQKRRGYGRKDG